MVFGIGIGRILVKFGVPGEFSLVVVGFLGFCWIYSFDFVSVCSVLEFSVLGVLGV